MLAISIGNPLDYHCSALWNPTRNPRQSHENHGTQMVPPAQTAGARLWHTGTFALVGADGLTIKNAGALSNKQSWFNEENMCYNHLHAFAMYIYI